MLPRQLQHTKHRKSYPYPKRRNHMIKSLRYSAVFIFISMTLPFSTVTAAEITFDVSHYDYQERHPTTDAFFMEDVSDPAFFSVGVRGWDRPNNDGEWGLLYTVDATYGQTAYLGSGTSGTAKKDYYKFRGEMYAAYRFDESFSPFVGLGYRYLLDDSGGVISSTGALGYDRESQYLYLPVGIRLDATDKFYIKAQYNVFLKGRQISYIYGTIENEQNTGWGVDFTANYKISDKWSAYGFYRYWDIDNSTINLSGSGTHTGQEPQNTTVEVGVGLAFKF